MLPPLTEWMKILKHKKKKIKIKFYSLFFFKFAEVMSHVCVCVCVPVCRFQNPHSPLILAFILTLRFDVLEK